MDVEVRVKILGDAEAITQAELDTLQQALATQAGAILTGQGYTVDGTVVNPTEAGTEEARTREVEVTISAP
jgi:hypothetical protein